MTAVATGDQPRKGGTGDVEGTAPPPPQHQQQAPPPPPPEQGLRCPRCNSHNTKFCYYNNYSLSQPRHLCKACRRYWTKGGALRKVPVGGACRRKHKLFLGAAASAVGQHVPFVDWPPPPAGPASAAVSNNGSSIASCMESLSFINQDLHWKLQQQRLATMFLATPAAVVGGALLHMDSGAPSMDDISGSYVLPSPLQPAATTAAMAVTAFATMLP